MAQLERGQISERPRMALAHKESKGQRVSGRVRYGFRVAGDGVNLVAEPQEQRGVTTSPDSVWHVVNLTVLSRPEAERIVRRFYGGEKAGGSPGE